MKKFYLHKKTRSQSFRGVCGIMVVLLTIAFTSPAFAVCACCETMVPIPKATAESAAPDIEEAAPSCHSPEPVAAKTEADCEEKPATISNTGNVIATSCQFECVKSISMTGFIAEDMFPGSGPVQVKAPLAGFASLLTLASQSHGLVAAYESPPNLLAIYTDRYSTILPPRI
ncbi:MAG: hypothetical protein VCC01_08290 [Candidatus Hydrogenedentota bacterium]